MKQFKRLLSLGLAFVLAFCTLSAGMVVHAKKTSSMPFASLKVGNRKVRLSQKERFYAVLEYDSTEAKVSWTLKEGCSISEATYYTSEGYSGDIHFDNGDTIRVPKNGYTDVQFTVAGDSDVYRLQIFNGKAKLKGETFRAGTGSRWPDYQGLSGYEKVVSIKSSKPKVLKVKKADVLNECWLTPKKAGKCKVTVVLKIDGKKRSFSANYTVKK